MVKRADPHSVLIVKLSGHDCVSISRSWPNDVTTRACSTNPCTNAVYVIRGCPRKASASSSDSAVMPEPETMSALTSPVAEAPGTARHPARCSVRLTRAVRSLPNPRSFRHIRQAARPRHSRNKWCRNLPTTAVTRVPTAAPERSENRALNYVAQRSGKPGAALSR